MHLNHVTCCWAYALVTTWRKVRQVHLGGHSFSTACSQEIVGLQNGEGFLLKFQRNPHIVGRQNVGSMQVKAHQTLKKTKTTFP